MGRVRTAAAASAAIGLATAAAAPAAVRTATFPVSVTVAAACSVSAAPLAFGVYKPAAGARRATTRLRVACARGTAFRVALSAGSTAGTTVTQRLLANGTATLQYNLYTNPARTIIWGDGTGASRTRAGRGRGPARPISMVVYGMLPDNAFNRSALAGTYKDMIVVTVTY